MKKMISKVLLGAVILAAASSSAMAGCTTGKAVINGELVDAWICCNADGTRCWIWWQER